MNKFSAIILILVAGQGVSATLTLNDVQGIVITGNTTFSDQKVVVNFQSTKECCIDNSCITYSSVDLENPTTKELKLALDGYQYDVNADIILTHSAKLISASATPMRSCRKPDNGYPTIGSDMAISASNVYFGISSAYFDVKNWRLTLTSIDGNLTCENGVQIVDDLIFKNDFE